MNRRNKILVSGVIASLIFVFIFTFTTTGSDDDHHHVVHQITKISSPPIVTTEEQSREDKKTNAQPISTPPTEHKNEFEEKSSSSTTTFWNIEEPKFDSSSAKLDSMKFSSSTFSNSITNKNNKFSKILFSDPDHLVGMRTIDILKEKECNPERFIFVNTHTFGRHHNQLQEILHIIAFARKLNRTAVLGFFRANHKWWGPGEFYDLDLLLKRECVVTPSDFKSLWNFLVIKKKREAAAAAQNVNINNNNNNVWPTAVCLGQGTKATPVSKIVKCTMEPNVPAHYNSKTGFATTKETFYGKLMLEKPNVRDADFLGVSGEIAFFMRPGIVEMSRLLSAIKPSMSVLHELTNFYRSSGLSPNPEVAKFWGISSSSSSTAAGEYFALHLRQRERDCLKEVNDNFEINPELSKKLTEDQQKFVRTQCAIPVSHVEDNLLKRYEISKSSTKFFLASDHENMVLEKSLVDNHQAVMYKGKFDHKSLQGLAMDFFLLVGGKYFSGNQLSSISQNVCMMRLGHGIAGCHGCVLDYALQVYNPIDFV